MCLANWTFLIRSIIISAAALSANEPLNASPVSSDTCSFQVIRAPARAPQKIKQCPEIWPERHEGLMIRRSAPHQGKLQCLLQRSSAMADIRPDIIAIISIDVHANHISVVFIDELSELVRKLGMHFENHERSTVVASFG